jgi:hypothetical protein
MANGTMALVDPDLFAEKDVTAVYIAGRLSEAKRVEQTLSDHGIDYAVDAERFQTQLLGVFPREYEGVAFYVLSAQAALSRRVLLEAGLTAGLVEED